MFHCIKLQGPYPGWDKDIHFVASHDFFKSAHNKLVSCGNQFELIGKKVRAAACLVGTLGATPAMDIELMPVHNSCRSFSCPAVLYIKR